MQHKILSYILRQKMPKFLSIEKDRSTEAEVDWQLWNATYLLGLISLLDISMIASTSAFFVILFSRYGAMHALSALKLRSEI